MTRSAIVTLLASLAIAGCVKAPIEGRADPFPSTQIHFADENIRTHTAVGEPKLARDETGKLLYVTIPIRSASNLKLYVDYRVTFVDKNGLVINQTGWQTKVLEPNTPDFIQVNSTSPRAADFQVDFKYAQ